MCSSTMTACKFTRLRSTPVKYKLWLRRPSSLKERSSSPVPEWAADSAVKKLRLDHSLSSRIGIWQTGRPIRLRYTRDEDMKRTGNRHDWFSRYKAGFSAEGRLLALEVDTVSNGGCSLDLSFYPPALFVSFRQLLRHPKLSFTRAYRANPLTINTAFRGFGGPQGML